MKLNDLNKILKNIEQASLPNFPYDGAYLIKKGLSEGKNIGLALKKLEQNWIENNYKLLTFEPTTDIKFVNSENKL